MGYSDDILKLTGGKGFGFIYSSGDDKKDNKENIENREARRKHDEDKITVPNVEPVTAPEVASKRDLDYVIQSDLVTPVVGAVKDETAKPLIVVVDDDFETLDLLDIYLKRDYTYESFSGPREAVFFLNQHTPEIVFIDCKIHTMKALTFIDIIRTGAGNENVPFVLVGNDEELKDFDLELLPDYIIGKLRRPVARKDLISFIDKVLKKEEENN